MALTFLGGIADRIVLLGGTLAGGCVPGFAAQYRQRVGGRLDQVIADMSPFQEIANRYHDGSLDDLIRYHLASKDPTFYAEGAALQSMVQAEQSLRQTYEALQGGIWQQLRYLIPNHDPSIVQAVWGDFIPSMTLDFQGLSVALVIGVSLWVLFLCLEWAVVKAGRAMARG